MQDLHLRFSRGILLAGMKFVYRFMVAEIAEMLVWLESVIVSKSVQ